MIENIKMFKPKTPEEIEEFYQEGIEDAIRCSKSILGSPIHETPSTSTPLVISTGDDLSGFKWTDEDHERLRVAIDKVRDEERIAKSIKEAARVGNSSMEYYLKHGQFPTSKDQLEDL